MAQQAAAEIRSLIETWADAVRRHDLPAILAHHAEDIVMFDVPPPLQSRGMAEYRKTWDLFFTYHRPGQAFDIEELQIFAGDTAAFAVAIMRCQSTTASSPQKLVDFPFRLTIGLTRAGGGLTRAGGAWRIQHEHHSVPATD
jgi:ketosteroid isomerase-like protein